ncbi:MAG TPA: crossover junction endodeoxyribonuclease RuvC [Dehalococcoidia bacterium]|nr:MAG: crossover junction endodeoxyribonuclease RuvC [Dehalococcoidia bacterium]HBJ30933.1 crossover junction endodeoxyribonuclease RuvC [Dehalococcoidia bacterium]|tara:strand:- start:2973 stop:3467 length:495 start_codon:yes stop_codon:yes gene_type:complete
MLVLGVDPGTYKTGIGFVSSTNGDMAMTHSDVLSPPRSASLPDRLAWIHDRMIQIIDEIKPTVVAIERPFVSRNVKAAMAVGQAQAVAMIAASHCSIPVVNYSPREVKKAVTDHGGSSKEQVQGMVGVLLGISEPLEPSDRADALAVAICHINNSLMVDVEMRE